MKYAKNHTIYRNSDGIIVPSATTILKLLNKPSLMHWANYLGFKRLKVQDVLDDSASFGTQIHEIINIYLTNGLYIHINTDNIYYRDLCVALNGFIQWYKNHTIEPIFSEKSFTSTKFGGTIDFYGKVDDKYTIIDFKTSKKIRMSMFFQLALYTILLEENGYEVEQVGILLCNSQAKRDYKVMSRKKLDEYIDFVILLIEVFHKYCDINDNDKWGEDIV